MCIWLVHQERAHELTFCFESLSDGPWPYKGTLCVLEQQIWTCSFPSIFFLVSIKAKYFHLNFAGFYLYKEPKFYLTKKKCFKIVKWWEILKVVADKCRQILNSSNSPFSVYVRSLRYISQQWGCRGRISHTSISCYGVCFPSWARASVSKKTSYPETRREIFLSLKISQGPKQSACLTCTRGGSGLGLLKMGSAKITVHTLVPARRRDPACAVF